MQTSVLSWDVEDEAGACHLSGQLRTETAGRFVLYETTAFDQQL